MKIHIDFETRSRVDIVTQGAYRYAMDPSTEVLCFALGEDDGKVVGFSSVSPALRDSLISAIEKGALFYAFNANFERQIWRHVFAKKYDLPDIPIRQWRCVAAKAMASGMPNSLDGVAKTLCPDFTKDKRGGKLISLYSKPQKDDTFLTLEGQDLNDFIEYCKKDVEIEKRIDAMLPDLIPFEQTIFFLDQSINDRGIKIDMPAVTAALKIIEQEMARGDEELRRVTDGAVTSATDVSGLKRFTGMDSVAKDKVVAKLKDADGAVAEALALRQELGQSSLAKYGAIERCVCPDGRIHGALMYHAAHTGRWGGRLVQPQNLPQGKIKGTEVIDIRDRDVIALLGTPLDVLSSAVRNMFIADSPDEELVMVDYAAIEARVVAWLAGCKTALDLFHRQDAGDKDADIYVEMARTIYGDQTITKKDKAKRQLGKQAILGCGYGMGAPKFKDTCLKYGIEADDLLATKAVASYRSKFKEIPAFWYKIEKDAINATGNFFRRDNFLIYRLPSGRELRYYGARVDGGRLKYMSKEVGSKTLVERETYGGRLVENITQATARDIMAYAMLELHKECFKTVLTVHDEIVVSCKKGQAKTIESIMKKVPDWAVGLPLNVEAETGYKYKK